METGREEGRMVRGKGEKELAHELVVRLQARESQQLDDVHISSENMRAPLSSQRATIASKSFAVGSAPVGLCGKLSTTSAGALPSSEEEEEVRSACRSSGWK